MFRAKPIVFLVIWFFGVFLGFSQANAQNKSQNLDTAYIEPTDLLFAARWYLSHKYTNLQIKAPETGRRYSFDPNSGLNMGLGLTYQTFTLNIAVPFGFMNPNRQKKWPLFLDLQMHAYPQKWIFDFYGQFYRGYTMDAGDLLNSDEKYLREDMRVNMVGLNANYLFGGDKLSLAAAFNQVAIQKKSAFSPFVGFEGYFGSVKSDSLLLPTSEDVAEFNFDKSRYFQFGPNAGLAGTLVFGKGFFLTGVASVNYSVGFAEYGRSNNLFKEWGGVPTYLVRGFFGYNDKRFSANVNYVHKNLNLVAVGPFDHAVNTGNYRFNLIYKFQVKRKFGEWFYRLNPMRIINKNIQPY
ncbi:hypothetical protein J2X69_001447 [Algoriphagus sp. 4150]|uniref:DUF4421 domain-containing protein n=1 Tax=Algoriphagus sp. 4150 TaxID=2817756 RepID=UPI0028622DB7|nr:DUF4421 domain-containing protein [Algoriphagus sp. 4150]MDR7129112.1 hypothetical protein [Algoriphagus sp. 4150]